MNKHIVALLCEAFIERVKEHGGYGKGAKLDNAAIEFFVGACNALKLTEHDEAIVLQNWIILILARKGYSAVLEEVK